jgi:hypothetical protein
VLFHHRNSDGQRVWSTGSAVAYLDHGFWGMKLLIGVRCRVGGLEYDETALLDTGSQWSVLSSDLGSDLKEVSSSPMKTITMSTRLGSFSGPLRRIPISLVADQGQNLQVDATAVFLPDWPGPTILGFHGFIERIRLAFDPGFTATDYPTVFFGVP